MGLAFLNKGKEANDMNLDKFKRDYKYKSQEGLHGEALNKWIIIIGGIVIVVIAYLTYR